MNLAAESRLGATYQGGTYSGLTIDLVQFGKVELAGVLIQGTETEIYQTDQPGVVVKVFDLSCGKVDELSYGPYLSFGLELANFEDVFQCADLSPFVPTFYGANIDYTQKFAFIAMEYLEGHDLKSWCQAAAAEGHRTDWVDEFRPAVYEALSIMRRFHQQGIILIDFKPDHVIRLTDRRIKFVDLGAMLTPRQRRQIDKYVYSATPDHAELLIDASNIGTGLMPTEASDIFSAGVALFEMATGATRLIIEGQTADTILQNPSIFLFRDSQIKDIWRSHPHLKAALPLLETQLTERRLLFAELWHLLKGYVTNGIPDWDSLPETQQEQIIRATGTTFIMEQLPPHLQWLAGPIAQATVLRSQRLKGVTELMNLIGQPAPEQARADLNRYNCFVQYLRDLEQPADFIDQLNSWDVRLNPKTGHWDLAAPVAFRQSPDSAQVTFLSQVCREEPGHRFFHIVGDLEADAVQGNKLTLWHLKHDHSAWIGTRQRARGRH